MARRVVRMTEEEIAKRYRAGRGQGELATYRPWIEVHDLSSLGLSTRLPSAKTGRIHHLLSGIEVGAFLEFVLDPSVVDVHEQFPLDREDTRAIALEMGVRHPVYPGTGVDVVMTTDLVVHVSDGREVGRVARAVKRAADLDDANVLLKLEIERRFWERRGVPWAIFTDQEQSAERRRGLEWMHARFELERMPDPDHWTDRIAAVVAACRQGRGRSFADVERSLQLKGVLAAGELIAIVRHLCATGRMAYDPETVFDVEWPISAMPLVDLASTEAA